MATLVATQPLLVSAQTYVYYKGAQGLVVLPSNTGTNGSTNSGGSTGTGGSGSTSGTGNSGTGSGTSGTPASAPVLSASSNVVAFGTVQAGSVGTSNLVLANTGNAPLTFTAPPTVRGDAAFSSSTNCGATLAANDSCTVVVSFAPTSNASSTGSLSVATNAAGSPFTAVLSGTGSRQAIAVSSTSSLDFGQIPVGDFTSASVVLTNRGNATMNLLAAPALTGDSAFAASTSCASTLAPGASCITMVTFTPTAAATSTGRLNFSTDAPNGLASVALSGTGVMGYAVSSPSSLLFQGTLIGQVSATKVVTFTNSGSADLAISPASVTGQFALVSQTCGNALAAGGVCTYTVSFNPTTQGVATGSLTIPNSGDTQVIGLFGTSEQAAGSTSVSTVDFGHVTLGNSSAPTNVILNNDGNISLAVNSLTVTGPFTATQNCGTMPASVSVTGSCIVSVVYTPTTTAVETGTLSIATGAGTKTVSLSGTGIGVPVASLSSSTMAFNNVTVGSSNTTLAVVLSSTGTGPTTFTAAPAFASGTSPEYTVTGYSCGATLAAGDSCTVNVKFSPSVIGAATGTLNFATNLADSPTQVSLTSTGVQAVGALTAATTANFGSVILGNTSSLVFTYTNSGNIAATGVQASVTGSQLILGSNSCGTAGTPVTVAAGGSCQVTVSFTPGSVGAVSGYSVTVASSAAGSPNTVALSGSGVQVAPTLGSFANVSKAFASGSFALTPPSSNSGGAWTYTSGNPSVASVVNASGVGTVTLTGVGTTTITATQAANVGFTSATATMTLTVTTGTPVLGALTIAAQSYGVAPFALTAPSSNSTGAFSYTSSNTAVATVSGSTVTVVGVGTTTITANEAATSNFTAASTTATLTVSPGTPTLGAFTIAPATTSSGTVTLTPPTSNSSGAWTFTSGTTSVATISGSTATILSAGTSVITATQAACGNYAAISVTASLNVSQPAMSWNPSDKYSAYVVVTNNNLTVTGGGPGAQGPSAYASIRATNYKSTGKYYWEQTVNNGGPGGVYAYPCGIATSAAPLSTLAGYDMTSGYAWSGRFVSSGAVYGCAADLVNHTFTVYLGTNAQSTVSFPAGTYVPVVGVYSTQSYTANFAGPFLHLPTGFVAWQ